jgi:hypothetical protein
MSGNSGGYRRPRSTSWTQPPKGAERLLLFFLPDEVRDCVSGDLAEIFEVVILPSSGIVRARIWYWRQVLCSLHLFLRFRKSPQSTLEFWKGQIKMTVPRNHEVVYHQGLRIDKIPVEGAAGLLFVFATIFIFGVGIPAVRGLFLITATIGILGSGVLFYWHKRHAVKIRSLDLHGLGSPEGPDDPGNSLQKKIR